MNRPLATTPGLKTGGVAVAGNSTSRLHLQAGCVRTMDQSCRIAAKECSDWDQTLTMAIPEAGTKYIDEQPRI